MSFSFASYYGGTKKHTGFSFASYYGTGKQAGSDQKAQDKALLTTPSAQPTAGIGASQNLPLGEGAPQGQMRVGQQSAAAPATPAEQTIRSTKPNGETAPPAVGDAAPGVSMGTRKILGVFSAGASPRPTPSANHTPPAVGDAAPGVPAEQTIRSTQSSGETAQNPNGYVSMADLNRESAQNTGKAAVKTGAENGVASTTTPADEKAAAPESEFTDADVATGKAIQEKYDRAAQDLDKYISGASVGHVFTYKSAEEAKAVLDNMDWHIARSALKEDE